MSVWLVVALLVGWMTWNQQARIGRILRITALPEWSVDAPQAAGGSPTGYERAWRRLILPEHNYRSYQWIAMAQQMQAEGSWRIRHVAGENAPQGRESNLAAPYGWWLGALAGIDDALTGQPAGSAVERAALYADPLLQVLFMLAAAVLAARLIGVGSAGLLMVGFALWFPLAGNFLGGSPDDRVLLLGVNLLGLVALAAGLRRGGAAEAQGSGRIFVFAGACGGIGLWVDAPHQVMLLAGLLVGAAVQRLASRHGAATAAEKDSEGRPWRWWGLGGATVSLLGYLVEYAPDRMSFRLEANHPLYALAWYATGELLARGTVPGASVRGLKVIAGWIGAGVALLALPVALITGDGLMPWELDPQAKQLSVIGQYGATGLPLVAAMLPVLLAGVSAALAWRRRDGGILLLAGPVVVLMGLAAWQPAWASLLQVAALVLLVGSVPAKASTRWTWAAALVAVPGMALLFQAPASGREDTLTESELVGLIERDFAHRLSQWGQGRELVVLAPPEMTGALNHYAGIRGLGTFAWENRAGLTAAARIASATSPDEAFELVNQRGVTHIVMPGWDSFLDDYAGLGRAAKTGAAGENSFVAALHRWEQPEWLRPRAYQIPHVSGFEGQGLTMFEVVDPQDGPSAMSRMAEYFVETGQLERAARARQVLKRYPGHVGALAAMAKVDAARQDSGAFGETMAELMPLVEAGSGRALAWDRRVSLAVVLATARKTDAAREQLEQCLRQATEARLRSLSAQSLFQLLILAKRQGLDFPSPEMARVALELLPPEARGRL